MTPRSIQRCAPMPMTPRRSTATISSSASAVEPVGAAEPVADIDQRRRDHRDEGDREPRHLLRRPGLQVAVRRRIQHREADAGDHADQQDQAPLDAAHLVGEAELAAADIGREARHRAIRAAGGEPDRLRQRRRHGRRDLGDRVGLRHAARRIAPLHLEQDVAADRRRDRRAAAGLDAAMLDDDGADIARRADRREGDEQRVVALLPRDLGLPCAGRARARTG